MKHFGRIAIACLLLACGGMAAAATPKAPAFVAEADRVVQDGRPVRIELSQTEIGAVTEIGRIASAANGGGALGALIIQERDDRKNVFEAMAVQKANALVAPIRRSLASFDAAGLAIEAVKQGLNDTPWFQVSTVDIVREPKAAKALEFGQSARSRQSAVVSIAYYLSYDLAQIEAVATINLMKKDPKRPKDVELFCIQTVTSVVRLKNPSYDAHENARSWYADDGKLARSALDTAFTHLGKQIPSALGMTNAQITALGDKGQTMAYAAGRYGPVIQHEPYGPGSTEIWAKGLLSLQLIP